MNKKVFEDELISGMQQELRKQASADPPNLVKAAECLHAALEIFEDVGQPVLADQVLQVLEGISKQAVTHSSKAEAVPAPEELMAAGITQRDMQGLAKGDKSSVAKFNIVLRQMGISDHAMGQLIGPANVMSEEDARKVINPNLAFSKIWEMQSTGQQAKQPSHSDPHTKGLTPDKEVENLKHHGTVFNMTDDSSADDELMNMEVKDDALEVSDQDVPMADFEDERN